MPNRMEAWQAGAEHLLWGTAVCHMEMTPATFRKTLEHESCYAEPHRGVASLQNEKLLVKVDQVLLREFSCLAGSHTHGLLRSPLKQPHARR